MDLVHIRYTFNTGRLNGIGQSTLTFRVATPSSCQSNNCSANGWNDIKYDKIAQKNMKIAQLRYNYSDTGFPLSKMMTSIQTQHMMCMVCVINNAVESVMFIRTMNTIKVMVIIVVIIVIMIQGRTKMRLRQMNLKTFSMKQCIKQIH